MRMTGFVSFEKAARPVGLGYRIKSASQKLSAKLDTKMIKIPLSTLIAVLSPCALRVGDPFCSVPQILLMRRTAVS